MERKDSFTNYHWVRRFYDKMVEKFGLELVESYIEEMMEEDEQEFQNRRAKMLAGGWTELERGVYSCPAPSGEIDPEFEKKYNEDFEKFLEEKRNGINS